MSSGLSAFQPTPSSSTPRASAVVKIVTRLVSRPSSSAASARSRMPKLRADVTGRPRMPARRKMAMKASSAATAHTTVCSRFTGTPSSDGPVGAVGAARMAMPTALHLAGTAPRATHGDRDDDGGEHVVAVEDDAADLEADVEGRLEPGREEARLAERLRQQDGRRRPAAGPARGWRR